ncbi:MAG: hypothetical protein R2867_25430 [Caldilineaceae bacterium]
MIEGIHNFCDRWCERQAFTRRCANFAIGLAQFPEGAADPHVTTLGGAEFGLGEYARTAATGGRGAGLRPDQDADVAAAVA